MHEDYVNHKHYKVSIFRGSQSTQGDVTPVLKMPDTVILYYGFEVGDVSWQFPCCLLRWRHNVTEALP